MSEKQLLQYTILALEGLLPLGNSLFLNWLLMKIPFKQGYTQSNGKSAIGVGCRYDKTTSLRAL